MDLAELPDHGTFEVCQGQHPQSFKEHRFAISHYKQAMIGAFAALTALLDFVAHCVDFRINSLKL